MQIIWSINNGMAIESLEHNKFIFQFPLEEGGPWHYENALILLKRARWYKRNFQVGIQILHILDLNT